MAPETPDRFAWVTRWLQARDEALDYYPDASTVLPRLPDIPTRPRLYVLVGRTPVPELNGRSWEQWILHADRTVARTRLAPDLDVVTAFVGVDSYPHSSAPPLLFETLAIGLDETFPWRAYASTWRVAKVVHRDMCRRARAWLSSHQGAPGS